MQVLGSHCLGQRYGLKTLSITRKPPFLTRVWSSASSASSGIQTYDSAHILEVNCSSPSAMHHTSHFFYNTFEIDWCKPSSLDWFLWALLQLECPHLCLWRAEKSTKSERLRVKDKDKGATTMSALSRNCLYCFITLYK